MDGSPPIKVLSLIASAELGGAERVLLDVVRFLDRTRYDPWVIVPGSGPLVAELEAVGAPVKVIDLFGRGGSLGRYSHPEDYFRALSGWPQLVRGLAKLAALVNEQNIRIIHSHSLKTHILTCLLSPLVRCRLIWHVHDFYLRRSGFLWLALCAEVFPDLLIANSQAVADQFPRRSRIAVIYNGVDVETFRPSPGGRRHRDGCWIGMVGAFAPWKGQHIFVQAAAEVVERIPDATFFLIGDVIYATAGHRDYRRELEALVRRLGLEGRVVFTGFRRDIAAVLADLDIVVHCSVEPEPFGRAVIEAMSCGKPVIAARGGGVSEIIVDGEDGLLVPPGDARLLAEAILTLTGDLGRRVRLGEGARRRIEERFRIQDQVRQIEQCYERLL